MYQGSFSMLIKCILASEISFSLNVDDLNTFSIALDFYNCITCFVYQFYITKVMFRKIIVFENH